MRELARGFIPCGECQSYVYAREGCEHWGAASKPTPERELERVAASGPDTRTTPKRQLERLAKGTTQRTMLARAGLDPLGQVRAAGVGRLLSAGNRLVHAGLFERISSGVYAITPAGRELLGQIASVTSEDR